ncbi:MAG: PAS domain S-box protein [Polynucleobacter sp.]|nr:MAG: PAS domain S-box protein [Polynucleobacter sp.]
MALILWTLNYQDKNQQQYTLYRESAYAKQRIMMRFNSNEEALLELSREITTSINQMQNPDAFLRRATTLIQDSPEILHLRWIDTEKRKLWNIPVVINHPEWFERPKVKGMIESELSSLYAVTSETNKSEYGKILNLSYEDKENANNLDRENIFWHVTPVIQRGKVIGAIAVIYSSRRVLKHMIPSELNGLYRFSLIDPQGREIATSNPKKTTARSMEHSISIDKLGTPLSLSVSSYPPPTNLTYRTLIWLVIGLSGFVLWSLWSVWKQTTQRYAVQKDLQIETNFRRAMEESNTIGMRAHDMTGKITYVNPAFCKMVGWHKDERIGMSAPFPFWPSELIPDLNKKMSLALAGNSPKTGFEAILKKKDGQTFNIRTFVSKLNDEKGQQIGWVSSIVDISEPVKARQELALAQERFTTVLESLDAAVSVISLQSGHLLFANKYYRDHFGTTTQAHLDLAGREIEPSTVDELDNDSVDGFVGLPGSELTPAKSDFREIQMKDSKFWYEVRRRYISWVDGHLAQLIVATDIPARKNADELARQQEEKMQFSSRLATMGEMASSLAHELNQPLAAISNYCTGIANRLKSSQDLNIEKDILPAIEKATTQAHRAGTIIQRIRGFVKRSQPQSKNVDIRSIIEDSVGLAEIEAQRYGVQLSTSLADNIPTVFLDPILIQQVLVNLLKNAIDAVKNGTNHHPNAKIIALKVDIDQIVNPSMLRIQVIDHGPGIPEDALERLYEPFFSTKQDGMGIGLNICRSIVESHRGRLWVTNHATEKDPDLSGCTFTILLPLD